MDAQTTSLAPAGLSAGSRVLQLSLAALLGIVVIGFVGFSHMDVVHNASHDYRHSMAFPCH
jgi:cobalt transporter subunit CbtB